MRLQLLLPHGCKACTLVCLIFSLWASSAESAAINYGNFGPVPPGVAFLNVIESSGTDPVPLFGPPTPYTTGLDFNPTSFVASASGGAADITDGQLNYTASGNQVPNQLTAINTISLFEAGDFTLLGAGTPATAVFAGAIIRATVTAIDGVNVAPINLTPVNASVGFNLIANPGIVQPWGLGLLLDIQAQLIGLGVPYTIGATNVEISIDNQLDALSESGSLAFIAKKEFILGITAVGVNVPEPSLLGLIFCGAPLLRRRRAS